MKRIIALFFVSVMLFVLATPVFASADLEAMQTQVAWLPEPPDLQNAVYWVLGKGSDTDGSKGLLFALYFPYVGESQMGNDLQCFLDLKSDGQTLRILAPSLTGIDFYLYVYFLDGSNVNSYYWTMPSPTADGQFSYTFTSFKNFKGYWCKGAITPKVYTSEYFPLQITWLEDSYTNRLLVNILKQLENLYSLDSDIADDTDSIHTILGNFKSSFDSRFSAFKSAFDAYASCNQNQLESVKNKLDQIISLLGGNEVITTLPQETGASQAVSDYADAEQGYMESFGDSLDDMDNVFSEVDNQLTTWSNGFSFIRNIFEQFVSGFGMPYMVLLFSLSFGIIVLILGRRVGG